MLICRFKKIVQQITSASAGRADSNVVSHLEKGARKQRPHEGSGKFYKVKAAVMTLNICAAVGHQMTVRGCLQQHS